MEQYAGNDLQVVSQAIPLVFMNTLADPKIKDRYMWINATKDEDWNIDIYIHFNPKKFVAAIAEIFA